MKHTIAVIAAAMLAVCAPVFAQTSKEIRQAKKLARSEAKQLENDGYKLTEIGDLQAELQDYILESKQGKEQIVGTSGPTVSLNLAKITAENNAINEYVNRTGGMVKARITSDLSDVDGVQRDERTARMILRAWARNIATLAKKSTMRADLVASEEYNLSMDTFDDYVTAFTKLFVIDDLEAWCPPIRSKSAIRSGLKREFTDPSIAVAALGATPESLQTQLKTFGFIFENMCARDLRAYSQNLGGELSYYHDRYGLESDLVLHLGDGRYALIECKLGSREIEEGATHLKEIVGLIREHNLTEKQVPIREPDQLIVLTGGTMAYTREDGVKIIPLGCLKW